MRNRILVKVIAGGQQIRSRAGRRLDRVSSKFIKDVLIRSQVECYLGEIFIQAAFESLYGDIIEPFG